MPEANVANTITILGRTNTVPIWTHWKTVAQNDPANRAAIKINSLFITNRSTNTIDVDLRMARDLAYAPGAVYYGNNSYSYLMNKWSLPQKTTVIAISRDNPIWLQPGDFLQISGSQNYSCDAVCSYEFISDESPAPVTTLTTSPPVLNLNAAPIFKSGSGNYGGTNGGGVEITWTPPFWTGGVAITNYLVQWRAKIVRSTSPVVEGFTGWFLLERPVSSIPNLTIIGSAVLANPRPLDDWPGTVVGHDADGNKIFATDGGSLTHNYTPQSINLTAGATLFNTITLTSTLTSINGIVGFQFRVAPYTAMGLGAWSEPSDLLRMDCIGTIGDDLNFNPTRVGVVEAVSLEAIPNGVTINWTGKTPALNPQSTEILTIKDYRVRWSDDNGATWLPSAAGIRLNNPVAPVPGVEIRGLQNGINYVFSVQAICERERSGITDEIVGPWSLPTRNVMPPGYTTPLQAQAAVKAMFVRWFTPEMLI